jgi:Domain of unknown function (DUF6457)
MNVLADWLDAVRAELGITADFDRDALLDVTRDVAHGVARPAAPLTAFVMGCAVGAGADLDRVVKQVSALAAGWPERAPEE